MSSNNNQLSRLGSELGAATSISLTKVEFDLLPARQEKAEAK
jgi:hypothetical protein